MSTSASSPTFSPSLYHDRITRETRPTLRFSGGDFSTWQQTLRARVRELTGLHHHDGERVPLAPRSLWKRDHELGTIEKIVFTAEEDADVPAYVCIPKDVQPPYTWVICVQGHSTGMHKSIAVDQEDETQPIESTGDRDYGIKCMERGLAALCIEQRSFGERREQRRVDDPSRCCYQATLNALLLGRTLIGERVFDVDRAIDYLATRSDYDPARVGVMGNSGGGTTSLFAAALLPRVRFSMPSCYFCTFADSIQAMRHCCCNFVPGLLLEAEMGDVAGLIAPRPLIIVNGDEDSIFPIEAARREFEHVKAIYSAAGAPEHCHHVVAQGGHRFYAEPAWNVFFQHYSDKI